MALKISDHTLVVPHVDDSFPVYRPGSPASDLRVSAVNIGRIVSVDRSFYDLADGANPGTRTLTLAQHVDVFGTAGGSFDLTMPDGLFENQLVHLITSGAAFGTHTVPLKAVGGTTIISALRRKTHHLLRWREATETWNDEERAYDGPTVQTGSGSPIGPRTPDFINQFYADTLTGDLYRATGEANTAWVQTGSAGDVPPTVVEFSASADLTSAQRAANNVQVHAGANTVDFDVPINVVGSWIIRAYDKDDDTPRSGCTISVAGDAGEVNDTPAGASAIREIAPGGTAIVTSTGGATPSVKVTGNIFEPDSSRGATTFASGDAAVLAADHQRSITITGNQTISVGVGSIPAGFTVDYWASGGDRTIDGLDADHVIPNGGKVTVHKNAAGALVASGAKTTAPGVTVLDAAP